MIFVTVGTHTDPFDRLVRAADEYACSHDERVVVQRGASPHTPICAESFAVCDSETMARYLAEARVVVSHAADTILDALRAGRPVVAVPRRSSFGEHLNDHQVDFALALSELGLVTVVDDLRQLPEGIDRAAGSVVPHVPDVPAPARELRELLGQWLGPDRTRSRDS